MGRLTLPKTDKEGVPYLSYSQITTWKKSKREYMRQYFFGEAFEGNAYTEFGSKVGEAIENNDFSGFTEEEQEFLKTIPRYDEFEREIKLQMKGFYLKGFIDTNDYTSAAYPQIKKLADYKTGDIENKKAYYESDEYNQLEIYAAGIKQETKYLPKDVKVFLIGRSGNPRKKEELKLTGEFITITKKVTLKRIREVLKEIQEIAEEISSYYEVFLKLKDI